MVMYRRTITLWTSISPWLLRSGSTVPAMRLLHVKKKTLLKKVLQLEHQAGDE